MKSPEQRCVPAQLARFADDAAREAYQRHMGAVIAPRKTFGALEMEERAKKVEDRDAVTRRREHLYQRRVTLSGASPVAQRRHEVGDSAVSPQRRATLRRASTAVGLIPLPDASRSNSPALARLPAASREALEALSAGRSGMPAASNPTLPSGRTAEDYAPRPRARPLALQRGYGEASAAPLGQPSSLTWRDLA
jgi:hypothetical protein